MEENKKDVLPLEGEPLTTPQISEPVVNALAAALNKIETYVPTQYINDGPPDIDAEHLNHAEQAIMRVTNLANGAADAISALQSQVTQLNSDLTISDAKMAVERNSKGVYLMLRNKITNNRLFLLLDEGTKKLVLDSEISGEWTGADPIVTKSDLQSDWIPLAPYYVNGWQDNGPSLYRKIGNCYLVKLSARNGNYETDLDICRNLPFSGNGICVNCFYNVNPDGNGIQVRGNKLFIVRKPTVSMDTIFANFIVGPDV